MGNSAREQEQSTPIEQGIKQRRAVLSKGPASIKDGAPRWGLALSGGGLRSATFCFGVLSALARSKRLLRFDLLSSVSGGGYIAATLGSLLSRAGTFTPAQEEENSVKSDKAAKDDGSPTAMEVQAAFGDSAQRPFERWLRAHGRYLSPGGGFDLLYALAVYLRNLVTVHLELAAIGLLIGIGLAVVNIFAWAGVIFVGYQFGPEVFNLLRYLPQWLPSVALLLVPISLVILTLSVAYWLVPPPDLGDGQKRMGRHGIGLILAITLLAWGLESDVATTVGQPAREAIRWAAGILVTVLLLAWPLIGFARRRFESLREKDNCSSLQNHWDGGLLDPTDFEPASVQARVRGTQHQLTLWLTRAIRLGGLVILLGLIDRVAWYFAFEIPPTSQIKAGLVLGGIAAVSRALIPQVSGRAPPGFISDWLSRIGGAVGILLAFLLCAWWVSVVQKMALGAAFQRHTPNFESAAQVLITISIGVVIYYLVTGAGVRVLNRSSIHGFYRDRLIQSFLGACNPRRFDGNPLLDRRAGYVARRSGSDRLSETDDLGMDDYRPQAFGGPVHIINACLNDRFTSGIHPNLADRKGGALQISSTGHYCTAPGNWKPLKNGSKGGSRFEHLTLGSWIAISGAAIAPGMGRISRRGLSALATISGLRLGYWCHQPESKRRPEKIGGPWRRYLTQLLPARSSALLRECFGAFSASPAGDWYLSDGGHFENTGAYALLAQRTDLIVLVDAGADPEYEFQDLENLVRQARIDLKAEIHFLRPKAAPSKKVDTELANALKWFGSVDDIASLDKSAHLLLARIDYGEGKSPHAGLLLVVKPAIVKGLPLDLESFRKRFPSFPQQSTRDQFFSEAQWESYYRSGEWLGSHLTNELLDGLADHWKELFDSDGVPLFAATKRRTRREPRQEGSRSPATQAPPVDNPIARTEDAGQAPLDEGSSWWSRRTAVRTSIGLGAVATMGLATSSVLDKFHESTEARSGEEGTALMRLSELWASLPPEQQRADGSRLAFTPVAPEQEEVTRPGRHEAASRLAAAVLQTAEDLCRPGEVSWLQRSAMARQIYADALTACRPAPAGYRSCETLLLASRSAVQSAYPMCLWMPFPDVTSGSPPPRYWGFDYSFDAPYAHAHPCDPVATSRRDAANQSLRSNPGILPTVDFPTLAAIPDPSRPCDGDSAWVDRARVAFGSAGFFAQPVPDASQHADRAPASGRDAEVGRRASSPPVPHEVFRMASAGRPCEGHRIYIQIHGPVDLPVANLLRAKWLGLGASIPPVLNVVETADAEKRLAVEPVGVTTIRTHADTSAACVDQMKVIAGETVLPGGWSWEVEEIASTQRKASRVIEVWIPPERLEEAKTIWAAFPRR